MANWGFLKLENPPKTSMFIGFSIRNLSFWWKKHRKPLNQDLMFMLRSLLLMVQVCPQTPDPALCLKKGAPSPLALSVLPHSVPAGMGEKSLFNGGPNWANKVGWCLFILNYIHVVLVYWVCPEHMGKTSDFMVLNHIFLVWNWNIFGG